MSKSEASLVTGEARECSHAVRTCMLRSSVLICAMNRANLHTSGRKAWWLCCKQAQGYIIRSCNSKRMIAELCSCSSS